MIELVMQIARAVFMARNLTATPDEIKRIRRSG
jgi:hypothetical protein